MRTRRHSTLIFAVAVLLIPFIGLRGCSRGRISARPERSSADGFEGGNNMPLTLASSAFSNGGAIARRYTCDGEDISPNLSWSGAPAETASLALIADDPDAPGRTWTHWVVWNIPARATLLAEDVPKIELADNGIRQGINDFRRIGYGGPCPPPGKPHRYFFKLYALDARLELKPGATKAALESAIKSHILAETEYMGTYGR
jgi:Raf kinase inhibitor-like YbhB/YbcL family protein